ncbi:MAG: STAS domain-containing protein [Selenomonas ruminantium]|nr:STAS domain-containing protein [Selenomonas ruminantium]
MISLYLRPDKTQLMYAEIKKKKVIDVKMITELPECYSSFSMEDDNAAIQKLRRIFRDAIFATKTKFEEVYIILPDTLFSYVSCFDPSADTVLNNRIMQEMNVESLKEYFIMEPMEIKAPFPKPQKSIYVLKKKYVEMMAMAAQLEQVSLVSVEPFSMAFVRGNQSWERDYAMVEIFPEEATIMTFSAVGGIFRTDAPHADANTLLSDIDEGESILVRVYSNTKMVATKYFSSVSPDLKMIIFSEENRIRNMHFVQGNAYDEEIRLPAFVNARMRPQEIPKWLASVGTFLQGFDDELVYPDKNSSIVISSSNFLPANMQANAKARHWTRVANVSVVGDTAIIRVPERYNLINTALIKGDLEDAYKAGAIKVTVDFRDAAYIDSSAIRDLVIIYNRVKAENFKVVNLSEDSDVFKALYAAKLDEKFGITKSS